MLRAHAELHCLSREVIPVLRQIETRSELPEDQLGAALAYLEVTWMQARTHAAKTEAACASLAVGSGSGTGSGSGSGTGSGSGAGAGEHPEPLSASALRYRTAVSVLRGAVAGRVAALLDASGAPAGLSATPDGDARPRAVNGTARAGRAVSGERACGG